jgi:hypothetical protein
MFESTPLVRVVWVAAALGLAAAGCGGGPSPVPTGSGQPTAATTAPATAGTAPAPTERASQTATAADGTAFPAGARLIVLADDEAGGRELWALASDSRWSKVAAIPAATALALTGDGVAVATKAGIEVRSRGDLASAQSVAPLRWFGQPPTVPIVDFDYSAAGRMALVAADGAGVRYATSRADGTLEALSPAPRDPFTPVIRWLDEKRVLILSTDTEQVSRMAVMEPAAHTLTVAGALAGVRVFGVSRDGQVVAAATETAIYVAQVAVFADVSTPMPSVTLADGQVVWALALDQAGSRLFTLSTTVAPDGSAGAVHELVYAREHLTWKRVLDSSVPFGRGVAQVYLP